MKKKQMNTFSYVALIVACIAVLALVVPVYAEFTMPGDGEKKGTIGIDGKSFRVGYFNTMCGEGVTSDDNETCLFYQDPTADHLIGIPNTTGTFAVDGEATATATDGMIRIYNAIEGWGPKDVTLGHAMSNSGQLTHVANTVSSADILNGTLATDDYGDASITGPKLTANEIGSREMFFNTISLIVASGTGLNTVSVEADSTLMRLSLSEVSTVQNVPTINNTTATSWFVNTNGKLGADATFELLFLKP